MAPIEQMHTTTEVARITGISRRTIQHKCITGAIQAVKIGDRWLVPQSTVNQLVREARKG